MVAQTKFSPSPSNEARICGIFGLPLDACKLCAIILRARFFFRLTTLISFLNMVNPWLASLGLALLAAPATQAQFTFTTNNGTITFTGYAGAGSTVIIPASVGSLPVATIGDGADSVFAGTG